MIELESTHGKKNVYRVAKQMARAMNDVGGMNCVKDPDSKTALKRDKTSDKVVSYKYCLRDELRTK